MPRPRSATTEARELHVLRFLKQRAAEDGPATVKEIWEAGNAAAGETLSIQAYYKLIDRMVAQKRLVPSVPADGEAARYALAEYLDVDNAITLDDVYELLDTLGPTDALARVMDARRYFEERRRDTLATAARALLAEDPRDLVERYLLEKLAILAADVEMLREEELRDRPLEERTAIELREANLWAYRYLGLTRKAVDVTAQLESLIRGTAHIMVDRAVLHDELQMRIFGDSSIMEVHVQGLRGGAVAGSDGSTHSSALRLRTAATFDADTAGEVVTFNNSVVYVDSIDPTPEAEYPYYSIPISRSALDDPGNRGMVLAPFMYRYLSESEYEHMAKCATDVVQWRCDQAVFLGNARSIGGGDLLPRPTVQFRDGTVTPQEREYGHYRRHNEYGDMVREGLRLSRTILERVIAARGPAVFAGAVKSTQMHFFSGILNWYIARGSGGPGKSPLDPDWDTTRAAHISDNEAMSILLSTLTEADTRRAHYYVTFALLRPFHVLTEFYSQHRGDPSWTPFFERKREREIDDYNNGLEGDYPWLARVPDVADDDFVYLCNHADYVSFYIGHTAGDPPPVAPRYEFLDSVRGSSRAEAADHVRKNVELMVSAVADTRLSYDMEHNFLSGKNIVRVIPHVVYDAHEKCKALGRKFEAELKSFVIANLQALHQQRTLSAADVVFSPVTVRAMVERFRQMTDADERVEDR